MSRITTEFAQNIEKWQLSMPVELNVGNDTARERLHYCVQWFFTRAKSDNVFLEIAPFVLKDDGTFRRGDFAQSYRLPSESHQLF